MLAIHDQFTPEMRNRIKITCMGLGLVRLLQDAGRTEEARSTLASLQSGLQGVVEESNKPSQNPRKTSRLNGLIKAASCSSASASTRIDAAEMQRQALSIA